MNLHLCNGTEIIDADRKLVRFMESEYDIYDGVEVPQDSTLSILDILLSVAMNSRLDTADKIRSVWTNKAPVEQALAAVPNNVALQDENVPWQPMEVLFDQFCKIKYAGVAVATKILHKKRPRLIPVFDSVISDFIGGCNNLPAPTTASTGSRMVHGIRCFRRMLLECLDQILVILALPDMGRFPVTPVRVLEVLLWIENEGNGYYMSCPECRCERVIPISYGEPTPKLIRLEQGQRVLLDRSLRMPSSPKWHCRGCGTKWNGSTIAPASSVNVPVQTGQQQASRVGAYYFYENWVAKGHTAVIHRSTCSHCKDGQGRVGKVRTKNGAWSSGYASLEDARLAAETIGANISMCSFCLRAG